MDEGKKSKIKVIALSLVKKYCEIEEGTPHDKEFYKQALKFAVLTPEGAKIVALHYHKTKKINEIKVRVANDYHEKNFLKIQEIAKEAKEGEVIGVLFYKMCLDSVIHATPFLIIKCSSKPIILTFESDFFNYSVSINELLGEEGFKDYRHISVRNYQYMQNDRKSCTVIAINTLKRILELCQNDENFLKNLLEKKEEAFSLPVTKIRQNQEFQEFVDLKMNKVKQSYPEPSTEEKYKYWREDINFKAFYKGYQYTKIILTELLLRQENRAYFHKLHSLAFEGEAGAIENVEELVEKIYPIMINCKNTNQKIVEINEKRNAWRKLNPKADIEGGLQSSLLVKNALASNTISA